MSILSAKVTRSLIYFPKFSFSQDKETKSTHIFISNEQITEKAKQTSRIPLRKEANLFTPEYFKIKGDHMNFRNMALEPLFNANLITGLGPGLIEINEIEYTTPMIITSNMAFVWEVNSIENLGPEHFSILEYILPEFKYAVIGLNESHVEINDKVKKYLASFNRKIDNVDWFLASSAFNNCMENDVEAVGFFFV